MGEVVTAKSLKALFDPFNLLLVTGNITVFIVVQTLFFWFILSGSVTDVLTSKAGVLADVATASEASEQEMRAYLTSPEATVDIPQAAARQKEERLSDNRQLVYVHIFPYLLGLIVADAVLALIILLSRRAFDRVDLFLLFLVLFAFSTELVFYGLVVSQVQIVGTLRLADAVGTVFAPSASTFFAP